MHEYTRCVIGDEIKVLKTEYEFKVKETQPTGLMLVGWGGNNGSTLTAAILANKHKLSWEQRTGMQNANYLGSVMMNGTLKIGTDEFGKEIYHGFTDLCPLLDPNSLVLGGWDISSMNLADAMDRAKVLEPTLKIQLRPLMQNMKPLKSVYFADFIALNQKERADNVLLGTKQENLEQLRKDIREFKLKNKLQKVIVCWTANTERFQRIETMVNDTAENLLCSIKNNHNEISPSTLFAVASILENCCFINGSPQNTFVPGCLELAKIHKVHVAGDDFKSGQTKLKSVMLDFLVGAGIKPLSVVSYNHLGNNDGLNLSESNQFVSKEISKSHVIDDIIANGKLDNPDHVVVIKYVPAVGDSKRALDEYYSEIFMGGRNTITIVNQCEDSLLACPLILDLCLLTDFLSRLIVKKSGKEVCLKTVLSSLSYMLKAPLTNETPVINSLFRQRQHLEALFRGIAGYPVMNEANLEWIFD